MDLANSARVNELSNRIIMLQRVIDLIDHGATISSLTLKRPDPPPRPPSSKQPRPQPESESGPEADEQEAEQYQTPEEDYDLPSSGELTITTEHLQYPPQMMATIRAQEIEQWQKAYGDLAALGVTNVPQPGTGVAAHGAVAHAATAHAATTHVETTTRTTRT